MKKFIPYIIIILCALTGCKKDEPETEPQESLFGRQLRRLVVVYMTAENTLSNFAIDDLTEIRQATASIPSDCALAVYFDNASSQNPSVLLFDSIHGERTMLTLSTDPISSDSTTMQNMLSHITQEIKAEEYALVLWGHGSGWLPAKKMPHRAYGPDNGKNIYSDYGQWMETSTLRNILENVGIQWRYIFYDVCFMQCIELAYELRHVTEWSIASPAEIPGNGAPYNTLMPYLFQAEDFARAIPQHYNEAYSNRYHGVIVSSARSETMEQLAEVTRSCIDTLSALPAHHVQQYGYAPSNSEFYDMASLMGQWLSPQHYAQWAQSMEQAIPYRYQAPRWETVFGALDNTLRDTEHFAAASMYVPQENTSNIYRTWVTTQWAQDVFSK